MLLLGLRSFPCLGSSGFDRVTFCLVLAWPVAQTHTSQPFYGMEAFEKGDEATVGLISQSSFGPFRAHSDYLFHRPIGHYRGPLLCPSIAQINGFNAT